MGMPVRKPPPKRPGESWEEYKARGDVQDWRAGVESDLRYSRKMFAVTLPIFIVAVLVVAAAIGWVLTAH